VNVTGHFSLQFELQVPDGVDDETIQQIIEARLCEEWVELPRGGAFGSARLHVFRQDPFLLVLGEDGRMEKPKIWEDCRYSRAVKRAVALYMWGPTSEGISASGDQSSNLEK
jgi:hypothetical protein